VISRGTQCGGRRISRSRATFFDPFRGPLAPAPSVRISADDRIVPISAHRGSVAEPRPGGHRPADEPARPSASLPRASRSPQRGSRRRNSMQMARRSNYTKCRLRRVTRESPRRVVEAFGWLRRGSMTNGAVILARVPRPRRLPKQRQQMGRWPCSCTHHFAQLWGAQA